MHARFLLRLTMVEERSGLIRPDGMLKATIGRTAPISFNAIQRYRMSFSSMVSLSGMVSPGQKDRLRNRFRLSNPSCRCMSRSVEAAAMFHHLVKIYPVEWRAKDLIAKRCVASVSVACVAAMLPG